MRFNRYRRTQPPLFPEAVSMTKRRFAVVLVPVPGIRVFAADFPNRRP